MHRNTKMSLKNKRNAGKFIEMDQLSKIDFKIEKKIGIICHQTVITTNKYYNLKM